ncbi:uncharacterized protein LOC119370682 [Jatropha curcas]|uniref:uncharacterized protein LOC119370682 n=1 Tax=Jatropha curcas TaxID=180498 RepID=UPI0018943E5E|nr:uncharacterized protein LOC119370682 [Jatropha curcas]
MAEVTMNVQEIIVSGHQQQWLNMKRASWNEALLAQVESEEEPWFTDILRYMKDETFSDDAIKEDCSVLRKMALNYVLADGELYRRAWDGMLLRCMEGDCVNYVRHCKACQYHDNKSHLPAVELHPIAPSWPFSTWGIDIIGKITPTASNDHQYILVAVDYFSRWIEAQSYKTLTAEHVARLIEQNIFCRYGVPHHIVTDNGSHFQADVDVSGSVAIQYRTGRENFLSRSGGMRTILKLRSVNGASPFELVYGMEAVLPVELEKKSLRVFVEAVVEAGLTEEEWVKKRYEDLALLDGRRLNARFQDQMRKRRIARFYNKWVHPMALKNGDLVLIRLLDHEAQNHPGGKFKPNWHRPFRIQKLLAKGAAELITMEGKPVNRIVNQEQMKRFYV